MTKILVFVVEVDDNETPDIGEAYDVTNDDRYYIDARLAAILPNDVPDDLPKQAIKEVL